MVRPVRTIYRGTHRQGHPPMTSALTAFATALTSGSIRVIDLTHTLTPQFPTIVMPAELGQCAPFRMEEISRYDERGPAWYWNNFTMGEHTGTHFDAPIHWVTGKELPDNAVDTIPPDHFLAPACVIDCSQESAADTWPSDGEQLGMGGFECDGWSATPHKEARSRS